jgi:hypothetical protein
MLQIQTANSLEYHEDMTVDKTMELIATLKQSGVEAK